MKMTARNPVMVGATEFQLESLAVISGHCDVELKSL